MDIAYPWDRQSYKNHLDMFPKIWDMLWAVSPKLIYYKEHPPDARIIEALNILIPLLLKDNWVVVFSNNSLLLQILAEVVLATYSLTSLRKSFLVDSDTLVKAIYTESADTTFFDLGTKSSYNKILETSLLVWTNIISATSYHSKFTGSVANLLNRKLVQNQSSFLCTSLTTNTSPDSILRDFFEKIRSIWGDMFLSCLKSRAVFKYYKFQDKEDYDFCTKEL